MLFVRSIGRWTLTALVINAIIGSGISGLPSHIQDSTTDLARRLIGGSSTGCGSLSETRH
jgi:hypothetical protein